MEALQQLEVLWILFIQGLGDWLQEPMRLTSMLGGEDFYLLIMPILYWSLDATLGLRVGVMLLLSNGLNAVFKLAFHSPRPYWIDTRVRAFVTEISFGIPSGHAQNAAGIWGLIAASSRDRWVKGILIALIFIIGFSRLYLGVHFISDVLAGWLIGGLLLWLFLKVEKPICAWLRGKTIIHHLTIALATSVLLALAILLSAEALGEWQPPANWQANAKIAGQEGGINPVHLDGAFTTAGTWLGLMAGVAWLYHRQGGFDASGSPVQRLLRYIIGVAGIFIFWFVLGRIFPREANLISYTLRYLRYTMVGLWISAAAPLIFIRLGLASVPKQSESSLSIEKNPL